MLDVKEAENSSSVIRHSDVLALSEHSISQVLGLPLTPMSSTIILSSPEGPKELLTTFDMACVAKTDHYERRIHMKQRSDCFYHSDLVYRLH